jgi:hypothetical protein
VHYLLLIAAVVLVQGGLMLVKSPEVLVGELIDTDAYTRLLRVERLAETGGWYDTSSPRSNAPFGEVLHWTRPLDVLLLGGAVLLRPFFGLSQALHLSGVLISPLLLILTCVAVAWAAAPLVRPDVRGYAMIALLAQPAVITSFMAGRADHHSLILLTFAWTLGLTIRLLLRPHSGGRAWLAGAAAGFGVWVSPEFLLPLAVFLAGLALAWVIRGEDLVRTNRAFALGLVSLTALALLVERPYWDLPTVEYDRVSVVHLVMAVFAWATWSELALSRWRRGIRGRMLSTPWGRLWVLMGLGGAVLLFMFLFFPRFFVGPMADVDPEVLGLWLEGVTEYRPVVGSLSDVGTAISYLGAGLVCVPFLAWVLIRERDNGGWLAWLLLALGIVAFVPMGLLHIRFTTYAEILMVLPLVEVLGRALGKLNRISAPPLRAMARVGTAAALLLGFLGLGGCVTLMLDSSGRARSAPSSGAGRGCPVWELSEYLGDPSGLGERSRTIMALMDYGPEILYRTGHRVVATPYHRNGAGILDSHRMLTATDDEESRRMAREREVDLVLICLRGSDSAFFRGEREGQTLFTRLARDDPPAWLVPVDLPGSLREPFRLYEVVE